MDVSLKFFVVLGLVFPAVGSQFCHAAQKVSNAQICKAGIAAIMGRSPSIIKVKNPSSPEIFLSYKRPDDGTIWSFKCKIQGNRIMWGNSDGRWRTHELDEVVTYNVQGGTVTVHEKYSDGSVITKKFAENKL